MTLYGVDLSSHNPDEDWPKVTASFVVVKATEGTGYVNPDYAAQLAGARGQNKIVGHYHYFDPTADPVTQADYFLAHADWRKGELLCLDYETEAAGVDHNALALAWLRRVEAAKGFAPVFYTYPNFIRQNLSDPRLAHYPLWLASYDGEVQAIAPWSHVAIWQDAGDKVGVPGMGEPTDTDQFQGTPGELEALGEPVTAEAVPDDPTSSQRLLSFYDSLPAELRGDEHNAVFYEGHADFSAIAGAPWPEGHVLHSEYVTLWTWPGQPIRGLQPETFAALVGAGKFVKYGA